jgi:hypothetical protein
MPKVAMDFSKTVIYHFVCQDKTITCSYVGSTTNMIKRKYAHKYSCHHNNHHTYNYKLYQTIRDNGGWTNWTMIPLEEFACENKTQQIIREQYWIDKLKPELNCQAAYQPDEIPIYQKKYRETHQEKQKEYNLIYREAHKEIRIQKDKEYYEKNKQERLAYQSEYRAKKKAENS